MNHVTELLATLLDALSAARQAADLTARLKVWWCTTRQPGIELTRPYWPCPTVLNPSPTTHDDPVPLRPQEVDITNPPLPWTFPNASNTPDRSLPNRLEST